MLVRGRKERTHGWPGLSGYSSLRVPITIPRETVRIFFCAGHRSQSVSGVAQVLDRKEIGESREVFRGGGEAFPEEACLSRDGSEWASRGLPVRSFRRRGFMRRLATCEDAARKGGVGHEAHVAILLAAHLPPEFMVYGLWARDYGLGFRVKDLGFRVWGLGLRV